jgi:hypothetical protein
MTPVRESEPSQVAQADLPKSLPVPAEPPVVAGQLSAGTTPVPAESVDIKKTPDSPPVPKTTALAQANPTRHPSRSAESPATPGATAQLASSFLVPLKGEPIVLAMRSGNAARVTAKAFRLRIKDNVRLDQAIEFLASRDIRVARVEEKRGRVIVLVPGDRDLHALEQDLAATGMYLPARSSRRK